LPAHYAGRNVPDVSFNADPETGYVLYYTSEPSGKFSAETFYGGTSFVAPQLNGVTALLGEAVGRLGLLNYPLYASAASTKFSAGSESPVHPIAYGDNWFYHGTDGYNPGAGLGTIDVANFAKFLIEY
jgi:subtilase family serine protease